MKKVLRGNTYFLIILLLQLFLPVYRIFKMFNITDIRLMLLVNHLIIFIVPAIVYLIATRQSPKKVLKLNKLYFKDSIWIIVLAFVCQPIMMFFSLISQFFFENEIGNFITEIVNTPYIVLLLLIAVLPAITEEVTIRGVILSDYEEKNAIIACGVTGLLFGIMHLDPQQFLYATVLGFILAMVVRITNSIFAASLMHFIINGISITIQKVVSLLPSNLDIVNEATETSLKSLSIVEKLSIGVFYGAIAIVFGVIAYYIVKKIKTFNVNRGIIREEDFYFIKSRNSNVVKDSVVNIPLVAIVTIYLLIMVKQFML